MAHEKVMDEVALANAYEKIEQGKLAYGHKTMIGLDYQRNGLIDLIYRTTTNILRARGFTHAFVETYNLLHEGVEYENPNFHVFKNMPNVKIIGYLLKDVTIGMTHLQVKSNINVWEIS